MSDFDRFAADLAAAADDTRLWVFLGGKGKLYPLLKSDLALLGTEAMVVHSHVGLKVRVSPAGAQLVVAGKPVVLPDGAEVHVRGSVAAVLDTTLYHWAELVGGSVRGYVARELLTPK